MITKTQMKTAVEKVANDLDNKNNRITTLELKNELRNQFPAVLWNQYTTNGVNGVSDLFHELVGEGKFVSVGDNGTYQTYRSKNVQKATVALGEALNKASKKGTGTTAQVISSLNPLTKKNPTTTTGILSVSGSPITGAGKIPSNKISRTKALDLMKNNKGHFFTVQFIKQDGSLRTLNGQYVKGQNPSPLGFILVKEAKLMKSNAKEQIRNVNIQTLRSLKISGNSYSIKK